MNRRTLAIYTQYWVMRPLLNFLGICSPSGFREEDYRNHRRRS